MSEQPGEGGRRFRLILEYDGTDFEGWQIQAGNRPSRTIQGTLSETIESITRSPARVRGAGRTDAGVHALGQVASVAVETDLALEALWRALNARLPQDVSVRDLVEVEAGWDALREARGKTYRYQIWNGPRRSALRRRQWLWVRDALSVDRMREAGQAFLGRHDFAALQAAGSDVKTSVRTLGALRIEGRDRDEIRFEVEGEGFLRHMVRNLVGTLIEIGRGRWEVERAAQILASLDRGQAGPTAPAHGLTLVRVRDSWTDAMETGARPGRGSVDDRGPVG